MRIGITGPRGTLAHYLWQSIGEYNHNNFNELIVSKQWVEPEFMDRSDHVNVFKNCDYIIHSAAYTDVTRSNSDADICWRDNVELTRQLVEMCKRYGNHLILISTLACENHEFDERNRVSKYDPSYFTAYAQTKFIAEMTVALDPMFGKWTICRIDSLFGKNGAGKDGKFVGKILPKIDNDMAVELKHVVGLRPTYAQDVAGALIEMTVGQKLPIGNYVQLTNDAQYGVTLEEYYLQICNIRGKKPNYTMTPEPPIRATAHENLIHTPLRPWEEALKDYLDNECK